MKIYLLLVIIWYMNNCKSTFLLFYLGSFNGWHSFPLATVRSERSACGAIKYNARGKFQCMFPALSGDIMAVYDLWWYISVHDMNSRGSQYITRQCLDLGCRRPCTCKLAQTGSGGYAATGTALVMLHREQRRRALTFVNYWLPFYLRTCLLIDLRACINSLVTHAW